MAEMTPRTLSGFMELKCEAEAEAARQEASRALEGGTEEIPEATEITENKGETNNG